MASGVDRMQPRADAAAGREVASGTATPNHNREARGLSGNGSSDYVVESGQYKDREQNGELVLTKTSCTFIRVSFPPKTAKLKQFADLLELLNEIRGCTHVLQIVANWNRNHKGYPPTSRHRSRAAIHRDSGNTWPTKRSASSLWTKTLQKAEPSRLKTRTSARNSKPSIQRRLHSTIAARFHWTKSSPAFSKTSLVSSFEAGQAWPTAMSRLTADYRRRRGCRVHTGVADFGWMVGQRR